MEKIIDRIKMVLFLTPSSWEEIKTEQVSETELTKDFLAFITAVPAISGFLGCLFLGENFFQSLSWAGLFYAISIAGVYLAAKIIGFLAPSFNAEKDEQAIFTLTAYSFTPILLAGIFFLIPPIYGLSIVGLYGFYLFWIGFPKFIDCSEEEKFNYSFISIIVLLIIVLLIFLLPALISGTSVYYQIV